MVYANITLVTYKIQGLPLGKRHLVLIKKRREHLLRFFHKALSPVSPGCSNPGIELSLLRLSVDVLQLIVTKYNQMKRLKGKCYSFTDILYYVPTFYFKNLDYRLIF